MTFRKLLVPPLVPVALLLLLCVWTVFSETAGDTRMIDGQLDDAPRNSAMILGVISPMIYVILFVANLMDSGWDQYGVKRAWWGTGGLVVVFGALFGFMLYAPRVDSSPAFAIGMGLTTTIAIFVPMALIRRHMLPPPARENAG